MKFKDLLESGFISDSDAVRLRIDINGKEKLYKGNWYEEGILNCMDLEVGSMTCNREWGTARRMWDINLETESVAQEKTNAQSAPRAVCEESVIEHAATEGETC